jgi:H+/Cl- antiporter ClcA
MNNDRNKKIEEILSSLDSSPKASAPAYFYTRLMSRMENGVAKDVKKSWLLRPAFALSVLAAVILINAAVVLKSDSGNETSTTADAETLQSLAAEYSLNDNSYVYDLNQDK